MKPIRIFFSPLTRRFYATSAYRELSPGHVECTGQKFDVTNEIASLINEHNVAFVEREPDLRCDGKRPENGKRKTGNSLTQSTT